MKVLAFDTSTRVCSVALLADNRIICEISHVQTYGHSVSLLPTIADALKKNKWDKKDIDLIAVGLGPGSFTGIRIGVSTAKGLHTALACKLAGISSLDALAYGARNHGLPIMPVMDAKKREVFCAQYSPEAKRQGNYLNIHPESLKDIITQETLFVGDGLDIYGEKLKSILKSYFHPGPKDLCSPKAGTMGLMALDLDLQDTDIQPIYVRPSDADITLKKQKG